MPSSKRPMRLTTRLRLNGLQLLGASDGSGPARRAPRIHLAVNGLMNTLYLDDLRDKTHRRPSGRVTRGFSADGGFGYRRVPHADGDAGILSSVRHAYRYCR